MKKLLCSILLTSLIGSSSVFASNNSSDITVATTVGAERASWGEVVLTSSKKSAYAKMKTYAGTAYKLTAKVSGKDGEGSIPSSNNSASNAASTTTGTIFRRSGSVEWTGSGTIQDTNSSGTQSATISKYYK